MNGPAMYLHAHTLFRKTAFVLLLNSLFVSNIEAHDGELHSARQDSTPDVTTTVFTAIAAPAAKTEIASVNVMGIEEKKGAMLPLDARFANHRGDSVTLGECISGPTILLLLYYGCHDACNLLLTGLAQVLQSYADKPATAPNIVTISVGEAEGPADAARVIEISNAALGLPYPANRWQFLTGSAENIRRVTEPAGFHFVKRGNDYDHPLLLIILSPKGKITRYITGTEFLPADITLSLMEASHGTIQPTIARVLRSCFSYDPKGRRLVFKTLQVSATVIITLLVSFVAFLLIASRSRRRKGSAQ